MVAMRNFAGSIAKKQELSWSRKRQQSTTPVTSLIIALKVLYVTRCRLTSYHTVSFLTQDDSTKRCTETSEVMRT
jgi:hypothetical protein